MKIPALLAFASILLASCASIDAPKSPTDLVITNARILDGTGNPWYRGHLLLRDGKIAAISRGAPPTASRAIDAQDRIVAPGFIDVHGHIEFDLFTRPTADNYILDGVTTVVTGNCGGSADSLKEFFAKVDTTRTSINVASLIGHNTVRRQVMGLANRKATPEEQARMEALVEQGMRDGAVGLATGLIYMPGMYSNTEEVAGLARVAARHGGLYATHMRNEGNKVVEAINEALDIGKRAQLPVQISHFKLSGNANWGRSKETVALVEAARAAGQDVTIDQYPYTASSTQLSALLPDADLEGGFEATKKRLADPATRARMAAEILKSARNTKRPSFAYAVIANHRADPSLNGKNISEVNVLLGRAPTMENEVETILDLYLAGGAQMVFHGMSEEDVRHIMKVPFNMVAADGGVQTGRGMPHPRSYGTNARVLGKYVREEKVITLEEAVRRMTSLPAQKFGFQDRGLVREGFAADLVILDEKTIADRATFTDPHQFSTGIEAVVVNGEIVAESGKHTGVRSGRALRKVAAGS
ncbi:MAG: D-aminoacylase [Betaproteobacteria bacterium]|nr:D-aminoacylase [Betaproteobacteria bacterium]